MLDKDVEICLENMNEYILNHRIISDDEHVFFTDNLLIHIFIKSRKIYLSFSTMTKPEDAANSVLYFNHIKDIEIIIAASFMIEDGIKIIQGAEAFEKTEKLIIKKSIEEYQRQIDYTNILISEHGYDC